MPSSFPATSLACRALTLVLLGGMAGCAPTPPLDRGLAAADSDAMVVLRVAEATRLGGNPAASLPLYRRALTISPNLLAAQAGLARGLAQLGANLEAAQVWAEAVESHPDSAEARIGHGAALLAVDAPALAREQFLAARGLAGAEPAAIANGLGIAEDLLGDAAAAQAAYRAGLEVAAGDPRLTVNLALSLAMAGEREAVRVLEPLAIRSTATLAQRLNLALVHGLLGDDRRAAEIARRELPEDAVQANLAAYATIRALPSHGERAAAVGTLLARFGTGAIAATGR